MAWGSLTESENVDCLFGKREVLCEAAVSDKTRSGDPPKFTSKRSVEGEERTLLEPRPHCAFGDELVIRHLGGELAHLAPFLHWSPAS